MKRRKVMALLMTAVMTFTSVAPDTALVAFAEGEDAAVDVAVEELPFDLKGMPEDYVLDEEQIDMKADMQEHDVLGALQELVEGVDYIADTVICLADSEEEAQAVAAAYNGELINFGQGVAEIKLNGNITVSQAVSVAQDTSYNMPVVEPNYSVQIKEEFEEEMSFGELDADADVDVDVDEDADDEAKKPMATWEDFVLGKNGAAPLLNNCDPYLKDPSANFYQWMHDQIDTYGAWEITKGSKDIQVAVIDSGVYPDHPDLKGRVTVVPILDVDPNTYTSSHGTHVAGIIGASLNNGSGAAGVAPGVSIVTMNVGHPTKGITSAAMARAANECASRKIPVANISIGGFGYSVIENNAIQNAVSAGTCMFIAMGNEFAEAKSYPAGYKGVIPVASTNPAGLRSDYSNHGKWAAIAAPGTHIMSCYNVKADNSSAKSRGNLDSSGNYGLMSGTSMATPVATGAAALYMSAYGIKSPKEMVAIMQKNGTKTSSKKIGKILNVGNMFKASGSKAKAKAKATEDNRSFTVEAEEGAKVIYTLDGSDPAFLFGEAANGQAYEGAVELETLEEAYTVTVKTLAITADGELGDIEETVIDVPGAEAEVETAKAAGGPVVTEASGLIDAKNKAQIFSVNIPATAKADNVLKLSCSTAVSWSTSNASVLSLNKNDGTSVVATGLKGGKAKITCMDANKKKTVISVTVSVPASSLNIDPDYNSGCIGMLAVGKSKKIPVALGDTYGKPSNTKLKWSFTVNNNASLTQQAIETKAVKISAKGKISINKKKWNKIFGGSYDLSKQASVYITAETTDGTNLKSTAYYKITKAATTMILTDGSKVLKNSVSYSGWHNDNDSTGVSRMEFYIGMDAQAWESGDVEVSSSNPNLVGIEPYYMMLNEDGTPYIINYTVTDLWTGRVIKKTPIVLYKIKIWSANNVPKKGKAKITIKLKDGSNKKFRFTVKVK